MHSKAWPVVIKASRRPMDVIAQQLINLKSCIFAQYGNDAKNTGSAESQIALFTYRIAHLTEHVKQNRKDFVTTRSLTQLVGKRRALLDYLYRIDINRYRAIIKALGLRK